MFSYSKHFITLMGPVAQEFGQGTIGMAFLYSTMFEAPAGQTKDSGL